jgi:hypothetical protein
MGALGTLLGLPVSGPIGALTWIARQVAEATEQQLLDPARIEAALLALERQLEQGAIDEAAFEAEEERLLAELAEIRAIKRGEAVAPQAEAHAPEPQEAVAASAVASGEHSPRPWVAA